MPKLKSLMRGIYLRGSVYWLAVQREGKRTFVSLQTDDPAEAVRKADEYRRSDLIESGDLISHCITRYIAEMLAENHWRRSSEGSRGYALKAFGDYCGKLKPADIEKDKIKAYHKYRLKSVTRTTAFGNLMTIRGFFNWCIEKKMIKTNPCEDLGIAAPPRTARADFCTPELRDKLIRECPRDDLKFVLYCGFHAGLRKNEICEARPFWFDLPNNLLHLRKTPTLEFKDMEERTIPLTAEFADFIKGHYGLRDPFMLHPEKFHREKLQRYRYDFRWPFMDYMKSQGCEWVTPHIMRHTFASLLVSAGVSLYKVAKWLGDGYGVVEKNYGKLLPNDPDIELAFTPHKQLRSDQVPGRSPRGRKG